MQDRKSKFFSIFVFLGFLTASLHAAQVPDFIRKINPFSFKNINNQILNKPFLGGYNTPRLQFVDIDSDNDLDLFVQEYNDQLIFFENVNKNLVWKSDSWLQVPIGAWFRFNDIDKDGDFDLFCQGNGESIRYYTNIGNNNFILLSDSLKDDNDQAIFSELSNIPNFYDFDCNGLEDFFLGRQTGTITRYELVNSPIDQKPVFRFITNSFQNIQVIGGGLRKINLHGANSLSFGDLNADGAAELVFGDFFSRSLYYFLNQGTCENGILNLQTDSYPFLNPVLTGGYNVPRLVDWDNDNDLDLFVTVLGGFYSFTQNISENIFYYENFGNSQQDEFLLSTTNFLSQLDLGEQSNPTFCDIDADGDFDLFIGIQAEPDTFSTRATIIFVENIGNAINPEFIVRNEEFIAANNIFNLVPVFVDIDNDGDQDLFSGRDNGRILFYENIGQADSPEFVLNTSSYFDIDVGSVSYPVFYDIDSDNDFDLFIGEFDGNINFYRNSGSTETAQFILESENFNNINSGFYSKFTFSDFNKDSFSDLIVGNRDGIIAFYQNNTLAEPEFIKLDQTIKSNHFIISPASVDINNDSDNDLMCGTRGGGLLFFENEIISSISNKEKHLKKSNYFNVGAYPNPFNNSAKINVTVYEAGELSISIYDIKGSKVSEIVNSTVAAGNYSYAWDAKREMTSGVYFINAIFNGRSTTTKIIALK